MIFSSDDKMNSTATINATAATSGISITCSDALFNGNSASKTIELACKFCTNVTWFAIRDHFCQNICNMIYEKGSLTKHFKNSFADILICSYHEQLCIHIAAVCIKTVLWYVLTVVFFHKSHHKCFARSGTLLQIRSRISNIHPFIYLAIHMSTCPSIPPKSIYPSVIHLFLSSVHSSPHPSIHSSVNGCQKYYANITLPFSF